MADFSRDFAVGFNAAQTRLENSRRMQELKSAESLRRLQEQQIAQRMQLEMEQNNLAIEARAETQKAIMRAGIESAPFISMPTPNGPVQVPNPIAKSQTRALMDNLVPLAGKFGGPEAALNTATSLLTAEARGRASAFQDSDPEIRTEIDPATGKKISFSRTPRGWARIPDDVATRQGLQNENQRKIAAFKAALDARPDLAEFDAKGNPFFTPENYAKAAQMSGVTPANQNLIQQQEISATNMVHTGRKLFETLPGNVGIPGFAKKVAVDFGLDKMIPGMENATDAFVAETMGKVFIAEVYKTLKSDSNITKPEQEGIEKAGPDPKGFKISSRGDMVQLATMLETAGSKSRNGARITGKPITPMWLMPSEVLEQARRGQITPQEADSMLENNGWLLVDAIKKAAK